MKKDEAAHAWDSGAITKQPTETEAGIKTYTCTVCQKTKTESSEPHSCVWLSGAIGSVFVSPQTVQEKVFRPDSVSGSLITQRQTPIA